MDEEGRAGCCEGFWRVVARVASIIHGIFCLVSLIIAILFMVLLFEVDEHHENGVLRSFHLEAKKLGLGWLIVCFLFLWIEIAADMLLFTATNKERVLENPEKCCIRASRWTIVAILRIIITVIQAFSTKEVNGLIYALPIGLNALFLILVYLFMYELSPDPNPVWTWTGGVGLLGMM